MRPAAFLDRDGTLIAEKNYLHDPDEVVLLPGAVEGLRLLHGAGYLLIVVTNQAGVGRGYFSENDMHAVNRRLALLLEDEGVHIDGIYYCPHHPDADCNCRKPKPGMLDRAAADFAIDMSHSVVFGDKPSDIEFGNCRGLVTVLVRTGYGAEHDAKGCCSPSFVADNLRSGAEWIVTGNQSE